ncbi:hypothetical protein KAI46_07150, partial [bacterium]|nr:hypothetical protein [bacterium]
MPDSQNNLSPPPETQTPDPAEGETKASTSKKSDPNPSSAEPGPDEAAPQKTKKKRAQSASRPQPKGIATLFEKEEIKDLFRTYLITICVIEGFIFFVSFLSQMGPETVPFPWKSYFFAAFIVPLTITFLLGIIVISFDRYIFGHQEIGSEISDLFQTAAETRSRIHKF